MAWKTHSTPWAQTELTLPVQGWLQSLQPNCDLSQSLWPKPRYHLVGEVQWGGSGSRLNLWDKIPAQGYSNPCADIVFLPILPLTNPLQTALFLGPDLLIKITQLYVLRFLWALYGHCHTFIQLISFSWMKNRDYVYLIIFKGFFNSFDRLVPLTCWQSHGEWLSTNWLQSLIIHI